ncbi:MAG: HEPN domain-containing protein [Candidatus Alcyoniella australis]|nr:HEPN domain-containing protein [Candidatus Alcyoniella australis]
MDAKTKFDKVIARAISLCDLHERLETNGIPNGTVVDLSLDDLLRSALMLGVSGMDAYFRDKFLDRLVPYVTKKKTPKTLEKPLSDAGVSMSDVLELLNNQRPHRTLRNKIANWLLEKPMHDLRQVDDLFLGFGIKKLTENAAKKSGAPTINKKVSDAVNRRHNIAHYGDYFAGRSKLKEIKRDWTKRQLNWISRLVKEADSIIASATS